MPATIDFKPFQTAYIVERKKREIVTCEVMSFGKKYIAVKTKQNNERKFDMTNTCQDGLLEHTARGERGILVPSLDAAETVLNRIDIEADVNKKLASLNLRKLSNDDLLTLQRILSE